MTYTDALERDDELKLLSDAGRRYRPSPARWGRLAGAPWIGFALWAALGWLVVWMFAKAL
jgi:hypothetical protein